MEEFIAVMVIFALIMCCLIFIPSSTTYLITDTGYEFVVRDAFLVAPANYKVYPEESIVVVEENGKYTTYHYENWYEKNTVKGKSLFERWIGK